MKIHLDVVARLAGDVRALTEGTFGVMQSARPGRPPAITDTVTGRTWRGPDCARQAGAFYAGVIAQLAGTTPPFARRVLTEVSDRHGVYAHDGRQAARAWAGAR